MRHRTAAFEVKEFPGVLNAPEASHFLGEVQSYLYDDRPYIVLDCSKRSQMDRLSIQLLLCCLEEALKRNGDVKLASVSEKARCTLKLTGLDRIFEIFDTNAAAANSFRRPSVNMPNQRFDHGNSQPGSLDAA